MDTMRYCALILILSTSLTYAMTEKREIDLGNSGAQELFLQAIIKNNMQAFDIYLACTKEQDGTINVYNNRKQSALMLAVISQRTEMVKEILKRKPNLEAKDTVGNTALVWAIEGGNREIIQLLLAAGAKVDIQAHFFATIPVYSHSDEPYIPMPGQNIGSDKHITNQKLVYYAAMKYGTSHPEIVAALVKSIPQERAQR